MIATMHERNRSLEQFEIPQLGGGNIIWMFALKHVYQRWLYPGIPVGGLSFAFAAGPLDSLPLAMVYHWIDNFLFRMIFLIQTAMGAG